MTFFHRSWYMRVDARLRGYIREENYLCKCLQAHIIIKSIGYDEHNTLSTTAACSQSLLIVNNEATLHHE